MKIKTLLFCLLITGYCACMYAQDYTGLDKIQLKDKEDYVKNESLVLECSNYILNSPVDILDKDLNHSQAILFIINWMGGTADYTFSIDGTITGITKSNSSLFGVYLASMVKYVLENKAKASDDKEVKYNSILIFLDYCEDPANSVKMKGELKKMITARKENTLREYLKM